MIAAKELIEKLKPAVTQINLDKFLVNSSLTENLSELSSEDQSQVVSILKNFSNGRELEYLTSDDSDGAKDYNETESFTFCILTGSNKITITIGTLDDEEVLGVGSDNSPIDYYTNY